MKFRVILFKLFIIILLTFSNIWAQPDDRWRERNDRGNRYEGIVATNAGTASIELISFFCYRESYESDDTLKIKFYLHKQQKKNLISLIAQNTLETERYWMEAKQHEWKLGWNEFYPWPVEEVLGTYNIRSDDLMVLIKAGKEGPYDLISPAIIYHSSTQLEFNKYRAYFVPSHSIYNGNYWIYREDNNILLESKSIGKHDAEIAFPIIFNLNSDWQGLIKFKIEINFRTGHIPPNYIYYFYHNLKIH